MGIALGHVAGALLVSDQDVADRRVDDRVVDRENRPTRQAEHDVHALFLEGTDEGSAAVHFFCGHVELGSGGKGCLGWYLVWYLN